MMYDIRETILLLPFLTINPGTGLSHSNPEGPSWAVGNEADQLLHKTLGKSWHQIGSRIQILIV